MRNWILFGLIATIGLSACSSSEPTLAEELSQESLARVEDAPPAPKAASVQESAVDAPGTSAPAYSAPTYPIRKKVSAKKRAAKKRIAAAKRKNRKGIAKR